MRARMLEGRGTPTNERMFRDCDAFHFSEVQDTLSKQEF
jgi:hypothetical protein